MAKNITKGRKIVAGVGLFFLTYVSLPILAPILVFFGKGKLAAPIYKVYSFLCHQRAERSLFLFGEKAMYSVEELGEVGVNGFLEYRQYSGDSLHGHKTAICFRDLGIYFGMFLAGVIFFIKPDLSKPLKFKWIVAGALPMALDGGIQFITEVLSIMVVNGWSAFGFGDVFAEQIYVSNNVKRIITGLLFGLTIGFWVYPSIIELSKDFKKDK